MKKPSAFVLMGLLFTHPCFAEYYAAVNTDTVYSQSVEESSDFEPTTNFLAPSVKFTELRNALGVLVGAQAAIFSNESLEFGIAGYALTNNVPGSRTNSSIDFGYGGGIFGYRFFAYNPVSLLVSSLVGIGGSSIAVADFSGTFFTVEPEATLQFYVSRSFQIALGGGYRFIPRTNNSGIKISNLSGVVGTVALMFSGI